MFDIEDAVRSIAAYSKIPGEDNEYDLVKVCKLRPVSLSFLQKIFNIEPEEKDFTIRYLIDCYPVDAEQAKALQPFVEEKIDLDKYDYMLECHSSK